ncbi:Phage-related tail protein [Gluconacetobacter johannae DSM 13595]|uniref:Phage tail protein n=1 Tax=Gluconacetobacter johannae TaxID=112140 RepID=A0A7W4J8R0_9PROT|nr:phage tail protein [Gluconacetobacter johannae]GBQ84070.1 Phage-related tail protein [Gluconacetobacter johannae DSM 13595]
MANAGVKVVISAADRASAVLEKINGRIAALQAPVRRAQAAFGRFASLSGLNRLGNGLAGLGRQALSAFRYMGQIVPVLGAITGAASLAGIYRLSSAWAQFGTRLMNTSRTMGMAPDRLMAMQNAARLGGSSAESMTSALQQLSDLKWRGPAGFAPEQMAAFQASGIIKGVENLKALKPDELFARIAAKIGSIRNPAAQAIAATQLLGQAGADLLPVFREGANQWEADIRLAQRHGLVTEKQAEAANQLRRSQENLTQSVEGLGFRVAAVLSPVLTPLLNQLSQWIDTNPQVTEGLNALGQMVQQFTTWLRNSGWSEIKGDIRGIYDEIKGVVDGLGGWKLAGHDALIALAALYAMPVIAGLFQVSAAILQIATALGAVGSAGAVARLGLAGIGGYAAHRGMLRMDPNDHFGSWIDSNVPGAARTDDFMARYTGFGRTYDQQDQARRFFAGRDARDYFVSQGWTPQQAAGIVANLDQESGIRIGASGDGGRAFGIGQWHGDRQGRFRTLFGHDIRQSRMSEQLQFVQWELTHSEAGAGAALRQARTAREAGAIVSSLYERPQDVAGNMQLRSDLAEQWSERLNASGAPLTVPPGNINGPPPSVSGPQSLTVRIENENAPRGQRIKIADASQGVRVGGISQSRAMDPVNSEGGS